MTSVHLTSCNGCTDLAMLCYFEAWWAERAIDHETEVLHFFDCS